MLINDLFVQWIFFVINSVDVSPKNQNKYLYAIYTSNWIYLCALKAKKNLKNHSIVINEVLFKSLQ